MKETSFDGLIYEWCYVLIEFNNLQNYITGLQQTESCAALSLVLFPKCPVPVTKEAGVMYVFHLLTGCYP